MNAWHEEQARIREITRQVTGFVADALGAPWEVDTSADPEWRSVPINGENGARLLLSLDWQNADRLEINAVWPEGSRNLSAVPPSPKITVRRDRDPVAIAREISRRLLPHYLEDLADIVRRLESHNNGKAARHEVRDRLATRYPWLSVVGHRESENRSALSVSLPDGYGDVELSHDGSNASIELHYMPTDLVEEILATVSRWQAARK